MTEEPLFQRAFDDIHPKHYQEFRRLYNELLGYFERNETEKIQAFSKNLDRAMHQSLHLHRMLDSKLRQFKKQQNIVQKEALYERFKTPKVTIPVTHPFPLKAANPNIKSTVQEPVADQVPFSETKNVDSVVEKLDDLVEKMAIYNRENKHEYLAGNAKDPQHSSVSESTPAPKGPLVQQKKMKPMKPGSPKTDGTSLNDQFYDPSLYIKKSTKNDVNRSTKHKDSSTQSDLSNPEKKSDNATPNSGRKARIWDYIDNDKKSGGISHDL